MKLQVTRDCNVILKKTNHALDCEKEIHEVDIYQIVLLTVLGQETCTT